MNHRIVIFALLANCSATIGYTAEFCVTNAQELQDALDLAANNTEDNHIQLVTGYYPTEFNGLPNQGFKYISALPSALEISGGWRLNGNNCYQTRVVASANETLLAGGGIHQVLTIAAGDSDAAIKVSNLSITDGFPYSVNNHTGGLWIKGYDSNGMASDVVLDRLVFINNKGSYSSALLIESEGRVDVKNSLFRGNTVGFNDTVSLKTSSSETTYFTNNTVVNNHTDNPNGRSGVHLRNYGSGGSLAANNIFWDNVKWDVVFEGISANHHLIYNTLETAIGNLGTTVANSYADPLFNFDYTLSLGSPAIDAGIAPPENQPNPPLELDWTVGEHDMLGHGRNQGLNVDMGAMEYLDNIFASGFE
ncbi:MAG: choice-of-anchor Q domain-containing protein [Marinicella sp.]